MPHHDHIKIEGRVTDVFFHRFVVELAGGGKILADLGPKGAEAFPLHVGLDIVADGEMKPSELKVERIGRKGDAPLVIEHKKKRGPHDHHPHDAHPHADPKIATRAVENAGLSPIGGPRRKPKHFEVLTRRGQTLIECHVDLDGRIYKEKPVGPDDHKWAYDLARAA